MRIAHVITRMIIGGAQENTLLTCRDLVDDFGDDVLLITGPSLGPEGSLLEQAAGQGVPWEVVPSLRREIHPWRDWRAYRGIKRALRTFQPDVVHTHSAKAGVLGRLSASQLNIPAIIHTVHGAPFYPQQGRAGGTFSRWAEKYAAHRCHALVSVADAMTDLMVEANVAPREKFTTVYSGMEVEPFLRADEHREAARRQFGYNDEHIVVGKIARLFHLKGHEYLLAAAPQVIKRCPQVRFLLVGEGILRDKLQRQIDDAGLTPCFQFTGLVEPTRIPALLGAMDIVAHLSLREGLARVLPQGLIAGRPVVSYDIDGAREVVIPGETGFLLPPKSIQPLVDALTELADDQQLRQRLAATGRERFTDVFRHQHMTRRLRELYMKLLL